MRKLRSKLFLYAIDFEKGLAPRFSGPHLFIKNNMVVVSLERDKG